MKNRWGLTQQELRILQSLRTPRKIQDFLDTKVSYNHEEEGETCHSPREVLRTRKAHCIEGALLAAAALRVNGKQPLILDLSATRDYDHVIAVYKENGCWGAISQSQYITLQWRDPVFRTLRELVMSYFPFYNNKQGSKTLRSYSRPVNLKRFDDVEWMTADRNLWEIGNYLYTVQHMQLLKQKQIKTLRPLNKLFMKRDQLPKH